VDEYASRILASGARFLNGYASAIHLLACAFERRGISIRMEGLFPTSETLYDFQKEKMERVLDSKTFGVYGCCEINSIAFECQAHAGLHVTEENVIIEVLHGSEPAPQGDAGSLTLTTLNNFAMPLIRYQNEDVVTLQEGLCSCGRKLRRLGRIHGRVNDLLRATDGTLLSGAFIPYLFKTTDGIREMQVIQEREDQLIVKIIKNERFCQEDLEQRLSLLRRYLGPVTVEVQFVEAIERTPAGKLKSVVSPFGRELLAANTPDARH
jgi:phenylacetate-CoA ligase